MPLKTNSEITDLQALRQHERDAQQLRERLEELEPIRTETQQERFALQKQAEQQRQERSELLLRVFKDVNKFLGAEVCQQNCMVDEVLLMSRTTRRLPTLVSSAILFSIVSVRSIKCDQTLKDGSKRPRCLSTSVWREYRWRAIQV